VGHRNTAARSPRLGGRGPRGPIVSAVLEHHLQVLEDCTVSLIRARPPGPRGLRRLAHHRAPGVTAVVTRRRRAGGVRWELAAAGRQRVAGGGATGQVHREPEGGWRRADADARRRGLGRPKVQRHDHAPRGWV